ncbi:MAG: redoxin domain-containing protein [Bacteroidia bacterium]|nr:redoxin domain-containing protein [Bacteroidia bacterium]
MKIFLSAFLLIFISSCNQDQKPLHASDELEVYDYAGLEPMLNKTDDKTYVVNFWATWCAPCIKELPYFEQLNRDYSGKNVEVILVSLDFPRMYDKKLKPYIKDKNLKSRVVALNDPDMNTWIPKVNEDWTGSIPATVIYNKNKRQFYERSFNYEELVTELRSFIEN